MPVDQPEIEGPLPQHQPWYLRVTSQSDAGQDNPHKMLKQPTGDVKLKVTLIREMRRKEARSYPWRSPLHTKLS
jgi:hypothetical protein